MIRLFTETLQSDNCVPAPLENALALPAASAVLPVWLETGKVMTVFWSSLTNGWIMTPRPVGETGSVSQQYVS